MSIISLLVIVVLAALAYFAVERLVSDTNTRSVFRCIIIGVVVLAAVIFLLNFLNGYGGVGSVRIGE